MKIKKLLEYILSDWAMMVVAAIVIASSFVFVSVKYRNIAPEQAKIADVVLPVSWNDIGTKLLISGALDMEKFKQASGALPKDVMGLLASNLSKPPKMTMQNSKFFLNILWGLGLANKNETLEKGPMMDPQYGGAGRFASTGGWTLAQGNAMDHYSMHELMILTPDQQKHLEDVAKTIFRPCCKNSTYFPDCNHGMAMLGLLELMAAQNVSEKKMTETANAVNLLWFPQLSGQGGACSV